MPRLICTSRYIKNSKSKNAGNLIKYMGTREGVEKLPNGFDSKPATQKQHELICDLLRAYPPVWKYPEFQKYITEHSKGAATECINAFIERNADQIPDVKKLVSYMAERPGVEKIGKHGLFSQSDDKIDLDKICDEVANHDGVIWTHVVSLTREDAERLGYNKAAANQKIEELFQRSAESAPCSENMFFLISQLAEKLKRHKGKKLYGYLRNDTKEIVNSIIRELEKTNA